MQVHDLRAVRGGQFEGIDEQASRRGCRYKVLRATPVFPWVTVLRKGSGSWNEFHADCMAINEQWTFGPVLY